MRAWAKRRRLLLAWVAVALFATALRAPVAALPLERDEGEYAYIAWRWLAGEPPYRESFDQKPPAVFAAYALTFLTLGESPAAIHWGLHVVHLGTLAALMVLARRSFGLAIATIAGAFAAWLVADPALLGSEANTEAYALLPIVLAAVLAGRARGTKAKTTPAAVGACLAAALLFKPVALPIALWLLATACWRALRPLRSAVAALLAGASVLAATAAYLLAAGSWVGFWESVVRFNRHYAAQVPLRLYPLTFWIQLGGILQRLVPVLLACAVGLALAWPALARRAGFRSRERRALLGSGAWFATALAAAAAGGNFRRHGFLFAVPPLALLAAAGVAGGSRALRGPGREARLLASFLAAAILLIGVGSASWYFGPLPARWKSERLYEQGVFVAAFDLAPFVTAHTDPKDRVFVYGSEPELLFYARRRSATRYIYAYPLTLPLHGVRIRQREVLETLSRDPPRLIVNVLEPRSLLRQAEMPRTLENGLRDLVRRRYRLLAVALDPGPRLTPIRTGREAERLLEGFSHARTPHRKRLLFTVWERIEE